MFFVLPESPRYLAVRPDRRADLDKLMAKFGAPIPAGAEVVDSIDKPKTKAKVSIGSLFAADFRLDTIGLWGAMFFTLLSVYGVINWLPTILAGAKYPGSLTAPACSGSTSAASSRPWAARPASTASAPKAPWWSWRWARCWPRSG